jgi:hypothetical protein
LYQKTDTALSVYQKTGALSAAPALLADGSSAAPAGAGLGTIAKLPSTALESQAQKSMDRRLLRFALQSAARELLPRELVAKCLRRPIPNVPSVDVYRSAEYQNAHYGGLQVCASVWMCPVCSAKITERRRLDLAAALGFWREQAGGYLLLVTYTLRHNMGDDLSSVLTPLLAAFKTVHDGRWWVDFSNKYRIWGKIRALEVTHGESGWHPHIHVLYFISSGKIPAVNGFELELKERWLYLLNKQGRDASWRNGVDVRMSDDAIAEYLAKYGQEQKWKLEHEMTKTPAKIGKQGGRTAFQLLKDYNDGDAFSGRLFMQYAVNFKGKSQLHWSKGLRSLLQMEVEKTDDELAKSMDKDALLFAQLNRSQWRVILGNDARAELLNIAALGDVDVFWMFVNSLGG